MIVKSIFVIDQWSLHGSLQGSHCYKCLSTARHKIHTYLNAHVHYTNINTHVLTLIHTQIYTHTRIHTYIHAYNTSKLTQIPTHVYKEIHTDADIHFNNKYIYRFQRSEIPTTYDNTATFLWAREMAKRDRLAGCGHSGVCPCLWARVGKLTTRAPT